MNSIEIDLLSDNISQAEDMLALTARLTQRGHSIFNMQDLKDLYVKEHTDSLIETLSELPHPTIKEFSLINIGIVGISRRFLGQITKHHAGVVMVSSSQQYSDYSGVARFVVPYEIIEADAERKGNAEFLEDWHKRAFLKTCEQAFKNYEEAIATSSIGHDAASYQLPQALRGVLVVGANAEAWRHMISQRVCKRNSLETRYVFLRIWEMLYQMSPLFRNIGPSCMLDTCNEGKFSCGEPIYANTPTHILNNDFYWLRQKENKNGNNC